VRLEDIDILVAQRSEFWNCRRQLAEVKNNCCNFLRFKSTQIEYPDILDKVRKLVQAELEIKFNEATTRMMQLGITEFPD
jgi:hypothetical protein